MKILSCSLVSELAKKIAHNNGVEYIDVDISRFNDLEFKIQIKQSLAEEEVLIVCSLAAPTHDNLMELLLIADACKNAGASKVVGLITYFSYARQDRMQGDFTPIAGNLVAKLIEASKIDKIITLDLHSKAFEDFFTIPVHNINPISLFIEDIKKIPNAMIISPDNGGIARAQAYGLDLGIINKTRSASNIKMEIAKDVTGKNCIIIDDIIDSGSTICSAAELLIQKNAASICAYVTHAVLSKDAVKKIESSPIDKITITNSIPHNLTSSKFQVVEIDSLFTNNILIN